MKTMLSERTKRFVPEDKTIERIHAMLQDGIQTTADTLSQADVNLSKSLYTKTHMTRQ